MTFKKTTMDFVPIFSSRKNAIFAIRQASALDMLDTQRKSAKR